MVKVINNYTLIEKVGEGNFSEVYRAINAKKLGEFAVKIIPVQKYQENLLLESCTLNEISTLSTMSPCEYIVRYEDHFQTRNNYYFVYQYCNGGNLQEALKKEGVFTESHALIIFRQLLEAFKVLNRFNIMHRDVKPENIFFSNGKIKLGDFGFCKGLKPGEHMAKTMLGSPIYMAPEVLKGENYSMKADVWSLGVVLYEMLFGVCPYQSKSIAMLISHVNTKEISMPVDVHPVSEKTQKLLKKLLTKDYFRRISWIELFAYKIDEEGSYIDTDSVIKTPYSSNKSYSTIRDDNEIKAMDRSVESNRKYGSVAKEPKMKFYSEKYMNLVSQPIISSAENATQRKISLFNDNVLEKMKQKEEVSKFPEESGPVYSSEIRQSKEGMRDASKRDNLLSKHQECLNVLGEILGGLQTRTKQSLCEAYLGLTKVHHKLKEITENILVSETELLDMTGLINYEIIQVDRQMMEIKQEILKRKMNIPNIPREFREASPFLHVALQQEERGMPTPQVRDFLALCNTEEGG